ncbi:unannotated protein [freshwater metagenome]|uniref:Unannotated protein n=1 Tax=freshwater metagenome TaxID=449393 RepID=A0A6J6XBN2_9ZZZZ
MASAVLRSVEHHPHAPVVRVREGLQALAPHQGAPVATVMGRSDLVAQTRETREDLATLGTRVIHATLGIRVIRVPQARAVAQLAELEHLGEVRGADAPRSAILILARQQVGQPQLSAKLVARAVVHLALAPHAPPRVAHHARLADHDQVAGLQGATIGQWVTRATRAVGRRGLAHQQQVGEALAVILAATRVPALAGILEVVLAAVLVLTLAAVLVLIHAASTAGLAGETLLVQGQQRGLSPVQGAALAPSLCLHLRPNADQPEPLTTRRRSRRFSAMC